MKGLAFAVSLFHRLSAEAPSRSASAVLMDVEDFAARLVEAGKRIEGAFADAVTGASVDASSVPAAAPTLKADGIPSRQAFESSVTGLAADPVRALVGGAATPAPAPTPPAPGIAGVPAEK